MNFSGKEGHPNIQPSTRPGIEPGTSGLGGRDLNHCANPSAIYVMPRAMLYYAMSCLCRVLWYTMLCHAMLRAMLYYDMSCHASAACYGMKYMLRHVMQCYAVLCYAVLCYAMLCCAVLCNVMLCYAILYCAALCCVL